MSDSLTSRAERLLLIAAVAAVVAVLAIRIAGPSDLWHQTQPKTVSYTTDIVAHSNWLLPMERGTLPATKPPLYNWIAAPFVDIFGYDSEVAHKMPSVLALIALCAIMAWFFARRFDVRTALLAAIMLVANYTIFKLGYLARPDMLLVLWLTVAWIAGTDLLVRSEEPAKTRRGAMIIFWVAVALAWCTKGPVGLLPILFIVPAAKLIAGRFSAVHAFRWWFALPLALLPFAMWIWGVYQEHPEHVIETLWRNELLGRIVGSGSEAPEEGVDALYLGVFHMPAYFFIRSAPWSLLSVGAMIVLVRRWWKRRKSRQSRDDLTQDHAVDARPKQWLHSATLWTLLVIAVFTASAGKRADYIAPAFPAAALLAAWVWNEAWRRRPWIPTVAAACVIAIMGIVEWREPAAPVPHYGDRMNAFYREVNRIVAAADDDDAATPDRQLVLWRTVHGHDWAFLGGPQEVTLTQLMRRIERGRSFYLVEGESAMEREMFDDLIRVQRNRAIITILLETEQMPRTESWPGRMRLSLIEG